MTKPNSTEIIVILDRSGSMATIAADMRGGFDQLMASQRDLPGECSVTLAQFDDRHEVVYTAKPIGDVPPLVLEPRGWTALLDAMGKTITEAGQRFASMIEDQRPSKVIVVIITDGAENASKEYTHAQIQKMVAEQRDTYAWEFIYLGANQDAIQVARSIGVHDKDASTYTANTDGTRAATRAVGQRMAATRSGGRSVSMSDLYRREGGKN